MLPALVNHARSVCDFALVGAVAVETGEEMDTDLWMLVEELRDQNRNLIEELGLLQKAPPQAQ